MNESPDHLLAEGFARHAAAWAESRGAAPESLPAVRRAAAALSLAVSDGHVCLHLAELSREPARPAARDTSRQAADANELLPVERWREILIASGIVGSPDDRGALPLILDAGHRLYLHRYFDYERRLAIRLARARHAPADPAAASPAIRDRLAELFAGNTAQLDGAADWQRLAAALALRGRLTIISGGPGTGKTATVVNLLACLIALDPHCRIALAAPTGKAAARMTDAVRQRAAHLPEAVRERLPTTSSTVHRLLGVTSGPGFTHHAGNPLAIDALVVDEASMLDLALATHLLEAVPPGARIILLGDKDQLAAVESGAVFAELSVDPSLTDACRRDLSAMTGTPTEAIRPPPPIATSTLHDAAVWFTQTYRFRQDSGIGRLAGLVNRGRSAETVAWLRQGDDADITWIAETREARRAPHADVARAPAAGLVPSVLRCIDDGYAAYVETVRSHAGPDRLAALTDAFGHFRVLCALRDGPHGVAALNAEMTHRFRTALDDADRAEGPGSSPWFAGRPVLVLNNDYVLKLFNGDIGIALPDPAGQLLVHFPDAAAEGGFRAIAPVRMPRHETAFAMTVHKSQGSEFDGVLVMLPEQRSRVLTRELLYTAITRARRRVTLVAGADVLDATIATSTQRHSGLLTRLAECLPHPPGG